MFLSIFKASVSGCQASFRLVLVCTEILVLPEPRAWGGALPNSLTPIGRGALLLFNWPQKQRHRHFMTPLGTNGMNF